MKKRIVMTLLATCLACGMITGCGNSNVEEKEVIDEMVTTAEDAMSAVQDMVESDEATDEAVDETESTEVTEEETTEAIDDTIESGETEPISNDETESSSEENIIGDISADDVGGGHANDMDNVIGGSAMLIFDGVDGEDGAIKLTVGGLNEDIKFPSAPGKKLDAAFKGWVTEDGKLITEDNWIEAFDGQFKSGVTVTLYPEWNTKKSLTPETTKENLFQK